MAVAAAESDVWVRLLAPDELDAEQCLAVGFFITRRYLLTAAHCLKDETLGSTLVAVTSTGIRIRVVLEEIAADVALFASVDQVLVRPQTAHPRLPLRGELWRGPARRALNQPELTGNVDSVSMPFQLLRGPSIVHQLTVSQELGDHHGYSGGPVLCHSSQLDNNVIGMLVEQYPDAENERRATNVLFAITIFEAFHSLRTFDPLYGPVDAIDGDSQRAPRPAGDDGRPHGSLGGDGDLTLRLKTAREWADSGLITEGDYEVIKLGVSEALLDGLRRG